MGQVFNSTAVIGLQWGDEGKGKVVDLLAGDADVVARFQGGNNAGHTLVVDGEQTILHVVPSGALHGNTVCVIGGGVVVDAGVLVAELEALQARGYLNDPRNLLLSQEAHLILPYHKAIDQAREKKRGKGKIGTTGRGIGPAYEDKAARIGLRVVDLIDEDYFRGRLRENLEEKNDYLAAMLGHAVLDYDGMAEELIEVGRKLRPHVADTSRYLDRSIREGGKVLFEGAQGMMLDLDMGTYPYVTSSNTGSAAIASGAGVAPELVSKVIGISKAYTTRVGSGPFPTELDDENGRRLREEGSEFGATTGRPRRCGWFDAAVVRRSVRLAGVSAVALTKLDVLSGMDEILICTGYRLDGTEIDEPPASAHVLERVEPVYEKAEGWSEDISLVRSLDGLPAAARRYLDRLAELIGVAIEVVSVGPARDQTIIATPGWAAFQ
ncbi:MAG: adenylosuccinate synthase [Deltaproteobacteria bacterium]